MFENTICCVYSNGGMPPVEPRPRTSTFKLTLRRFLRPFTRRSHRPQTPPPTVHTAHHRVGVWQKMGRAPDCPCAQKCVSAIWSPTPPHHSTHHILQNTPNHMFENTICCVYSNGGMPPVAPRLSTSTFKLTLRRFLRPFTCRSHRPQTPPPKAHAARHRDDKWQKWDGPQIAHARAKARRGNLGPVPKYL